MKNTTVFGLILAGGRGSRMGGVDKGLALLDGASLVARTVAALEPQVKKIVISANRNLEIYSALQAHGAAISVVPDTFADYQGPLAGMHAGLQAMANSAAPPDYVMVVPTDTPHLPPCLVDRLGNRLFSGVSKARPSTMQCAYVTVKGEMHPLICLVKLEVLASLQQFLSLDDRRVRNWIHSLKSVGVAFDDYPESFANYNTTTQLTAQDALHPSTQIWNG